ncbi:hypothetical protein ACMFMF_006305 [Clarireedia jacksonii]
MDETCRILFRAVGNSNVGRRESGMRYYSSPRLGNMDTKRPQKCQNPHIDKAICHRPQHFEHLDFDTFLILQLVVRKNPIRNLKQMTNLPFNAAATIVIDIYN